MDSLLYVFFEWIEFTGFLAPFFGGQGSVGGKVFSYSVPMKFCLFGYLADIQPLVIQIPYHEKVLHFQHRHYP